MFDTVVFSYVVSEPMISNQIITEVTEDHYYVGFRIGDYAVTYCQNKETNKFVLLVNANPYPEKYTAVELIRTLKKICENEAYRQTFMMKPRRIKLDSI